MDTGKPLEVDVGVVTGRCHQLGCGEMRGRQMPTGTGQAGAKRRGRFPFGGIHHQPVRVCHCHIVCYVTMNGIGIIGNPREGPSTLRRTRPAA
jgi:hypothetical protein